jgi:hypothetical protein
MVDFALDAHSHPDSGYCEPIYLLTDIEAERVYFTPV